MVYRCQFRPLSTPDIPYFFLLKFMECSFTITNFNTNDQILVLKNSVSPSYVISNLTEISSVSMLQVE